MGNTKNTTVTNSLEGGSDLTLHCKSGDNDLGVQVLHPNAPFECENIITFFSRENARSVGWIEVCVKYKWVGVCESVVAQR